jgi:hypothetical protein
LLLQSFCEFLSFSFCECDCLSLDFDKFEILAYGFVVGLKVELLRMEICLLTEMEFELSLRLKLKL